MSISGANAQPDKREILAKVRAAAGKVLHTYSTGSANAFLRTPYAADVLGLAGRVLITSQRLGCCPCPCLEGDSEEASSQASGQASSQESDSNVIIILARKPWKSATLSLGP
jgi:hypothetical protein